MLPAFDRRNATAFGAILIPTASLVDLPVGYSGCYSLNKVGGLVLEIKLLGQFAVKRDGVPILLTYRPAQLLLAYFLVHPGAPQPREKLVGLLWPDATCLKSSNSAKLVE